MSVKPQLPNADGRPRIFISPNRDRVTVNWSRHPAGRPQFAATPGAALDAALAELGHAPAVIIWGAAHPEAADDP